MNRQDTINELSNSIQKALMVSNKNLDYQSMISVLVGMSVAILSDVTKVSRREAADEIIVLLNKPIGPMVH